MGTSILEKASGFLRKKGKYAVVLIGVLAVTAAGYRMALPGFTLERELVCGLEEHVHTEECYPAPETGTDGETESEEGKTEGTEGATEKVLACPFEGKEAHAHAEGCYETEKKLICEQGEGAGGHAHTEECYTTTMELTCGQEEAAGHVHDASCYQAETSLSCGQEEAAGHTHGDGCYDGNGGIICGQEEAEGHSHSDACYSSEDKLVCGQEETEGHAHGDGCYTEKKELACGQEEMAGHTHTEGCYEEESRLVCGKEEYDPNSHVHGDGCYIEKPVSGENGAAGGTEQGTENGAAGEDGQNTECQPICGLEEHTHTDACYGAEIMAIADGIVVSGDGWQLYDDGLLTITATEMPDYTSKNPAPWSNYKEQIKSIKVEGLERIGAYAFYGCAQISEVELPEGIKGIGQSAFQNCSALTNVSLPESMEVIQDGAFNGCSKLVNINLPDGIDEIGSSAFSGCIGLIRIILPEGISVIDSSAFYKCTNLSYINLPESITQIGGNAFAYCENLTNIKIPEGITRIENSTFVGCTSLSNVQLPESLTEIGDLAFRNCSRLSAINLPEGVTSIGRLAFGGCGSLEEFVFGENLVSLGENVFLDCNALERIVLKSGNLNQAQGLGIDSSNIRKVTVYCESVDVLSEAVLSWWKSADVSFVGEGHFSINGRMALGRPSKRELSPGDYYADKNGALYLLDGQTASLAYVPAGLEEYVIKGRIPGKEGGECVVSAVEKDALRTAEGLRSLWFEKPEDIAALPDYSCGNCPSLESVNGETAVDKVCALFKAAQIGPLAFYNTGLEGESLVLDNGTISINVGDIRLLTMNTEKEAAAVGEWPKLYTGEQALTVINMNGELNETDYTVARCYFSFENGDGITRYGEANSSGDYESTFVDDKGNSYVVRLYKAEAPFTYYYEIPRPKPGASLSIHLPSWYPSHESGGGKVKIWPVLLTDAEKEALGKGITGDGGRYHEVSWITKADEFKVEKSWYTDSKTRPSIEGNGKEEGSLYLRSLAYQITMNINRDGDTLQEVGKDYMLSADFTDTLILPDGMRWRDEVLDALENGDFYFDGFRNTIYVNIGNTAYELCKLSGSMEYKSLVVEEVNGKKLLKIRWTVRNNNTGAEMPSKDMKIYFGDEVIQVDIPEGGENSPGTYDVVNEVEVVQHFTHSGDRICNAQATAQIQSKAANCEMEKTSDYKGVKGWGDNYQYTIALKNSGAFPYTSLDKVDDKLSDYLYIRPVDMQTMFQEAEGMSWVKSLEIKISNAVLCSGDAAGAEYYPGKQVTGTDGKTYTLTWQDTGIGTEYEYKTGEDMGKDPDKTASAELTFLWEKVEEGGKGSLKIVSGGNEYTEVINDAADISSALEKAGYIITRSAQYTVTWELQDFVLYSGYVKSLHIPVTIKDSFMLLEQDVLAQRSEEKFDLDTNFAKGWYEGKEMCSGKEDHKPDRYTKQWTVRDYTLHKGIKRNGQDMDTKKDTVVPGDVVTYVLAVYHRENPLRGIVPLVDRMQGAQALLAPKIDANKHLSGRGLEEKVVNENTYYLLSEKGVYEKVTLGNFSTDGSTYHLADSVTVTEQNGGSLDTMIRWYLTNIEDTGTEEVNYEAYILSVSEEEGDSPEQGNEGGSFTLSNESWLNDHQSHRLYSPVGIRGTNAVIEKMIVISQGETKRPEDDVLEEHSAVGEGDTSLYRLKIENIGMPRVINGSDIYDILPQAKGFEWTKKDIAISYYDAGDNAYRLEGGDDWHIAKDEDGRYRIIWGEDFKLSLGMNESIYIYVMLTWPEGDAWEEYAKEYGGSLVENTFWCYKLWDKVTHELAADAKAYLQKGVVYTDVTSLEITDEQSRFYYSNKDAEEHKVKYYTIIYNDGYTKLYLNELQDQLPRGFAFESAYTLWRGTQKYDQVHLTDAEGKEITPKLVRAICEVKELGSGKISIALSGKAGDDDYIKYDERHGKYYLAPKEAITITYTCTPGDYADTDDVAINSIAMPYYNVAGEKLKVADVKALGPENKNDKSMRNDGDCSLMMNQEAEELGFAGSEEGTQWLVSDVHIKRGEIIPGITKSVESITAAGITKPYEGYARASDIVNWKVEVSNGGRETLIDYTLTDAMESPYGYTGIVKYEINYTKPKIMKIYGDLFEITNCEITEDGTHMSLKKFDSKTVGGLRWSWGNWTLNGKTLDGRVMEVEIREGDVAEIVLGIRESGKTKNWRYEVSLSDEKGGAELIIRCKGNGMGIPAGGSAALSLSTKNSIDDHKNKTYFNRCYITPQLQQYNGDLVSQGNHMDEFHGKPSVRNSARVQIAYGFNTRSEKKVEEVGNEKNQATSNDEKNYILLQGRESLFRYTLTVDNTNKKAMEKLILIDSLPQVGDHNPFTEDEPRFSEFRVDLAEAPQFEVWVKETGKDAVKLDEGQYQLQYSSKTEFEASDWNGTGSDGWNLDLEKDRSEIRSFRVMILDEEEGNADLIPLESSVEVKFTGQISSEGENAPMPGETAWNGFGYQYKLKTVGDSLESTPLKVGVRLPDVPRLIKELKDEDGNEVKAESDMVFRFLIYEGTGISLKENFTNKELAQILENNGREFTCADVVVEKDRSQSSTVVLKDMVKWKWEAGAGNTGDTEDGMPAETEGWQPTDEPWDWKDGEKYTIIELPLEGDSCWFGSLDGLEHNGVTFTHSNDKGRKITAVNLCEPAAAFELPETGGIGSCRYTLLGLLCLAAAGMAFGRKRQGRTGSHGNPLA